MADLRGQEGVAARALEFAILITARTGEARGARWAELDLEGRLWTVPPERMKAEREHRVPLSDPALAILRAMVAIRQGAFAFPGGKVDRPLSNMALLMTLRRMGRGDLTAHGLLSPQKVITAIKVTSELLADGSLLRISSGGHSQASSVFGSIK